MGSRQRYLHLAQQRPDPSASARAATRNIYALLRDDVERPELLCVEDLRGVALRFVVLRGVVLPAAALPLEAVPADAFAVPRRFFEASTLAWSAAIRSTTCPDWIVFDPSSSVATCLS